MLHQQRRSAEMQENVFRGTNMKPSSALIACGSPLT
jgi:hypothetical protein